MLGAERLPLFDLNEQQRSILYDIRVPRILLGACVGASLAVAGAGLQSLLRNPLAEPYLLGVSNGAALGTMLAFVFFQSLEITRPLLAFAGAGLATIAVYRMAKSRTGDERRAAGAVGRDRDDVFVVGDRDADHVARRGKAAELYVLAARRPVAGDAERRLFELGAVVIGTIILMSQARALNLMMVGERDAFDFGVEVGRVRMLVLERRVWLSERRWRRAVRSDMSG